jgi:uncharacterized membrane protein
MNGFEAAAWGVAGGVVAGMVGLSVAIVAANYRWPWRRREEQFWPRLCVAAIGALVGGVACGAAHGQVSGPWPALVMGVSAPSVIRSILARLEVVAPKSEADSGESPN